MKENDLQTWIIEPRDSLIVRDGKPFGGSITHAFSLDFPFPSTTTGGVRTRFGLNQDGIFDCPKDKLGELKELKVRGSLLAEIDGKDEIAEFYLPAPADALFLQDANQKEKKEAQICRLQPLDVEKLSGVSERESFSNLPAEIPFPVGLNRTDKKDKPFNDLKFWTWRNLKNWLHEANESASVSIKNYGIGNLQKDTRTHVAINENFASEEGNLFQTRGLEFNYGDGNLQARKFGLAVFVDSANGQKLQNKGNLAPLGGERRLVSWRESEEPHPILKCPNETKERIVREKHCRLMLLTPAYFENGMPQSTEDYDIQAIACNRYQTVSGWDFEINKPKPTRRLVPAGSILFLKIKNGDIANWVDDTWFHCIGDDPQAKMDGFGLSILGTWDGNPLTEWR